MIPDLILLLWGAVDLWIAISFIFNIETALHKCHCAMYTYTHNPQEKLVLGYFMAVNGSIRFSHFWFKHKEAVIITFLTEASYYIANYAVHMENAILISIINIVMAYNMYLK